MTSDTYTVVNHLSWGPESWHQFVSSSTNFSGLQWPSLVNFEGIRYTTNMKSRAIFIFLLLSSSSKLSNGTLTSSYFTETSQDLSILKGIRNTLLEMNLMSCAMVCLPDDACFGIGLKPPKCVILKVPLLNGFTWQTMEKGYQWFLKENYGMWHNYVNYLF